MGHRSNNEKGKSLKAERQRTSTHPTQLKLLEQRVHPRTRRLYGQAPCSMYYRGLSQHLNEVMMSEYGSDSALTSHGYIANPQQILNVFIYMLRLLQNYPTVTGFYELWSFRSKRIEVKILESQT